jgi:hypothetical protein
MNALHVKPLLDIFSAMTQSQASPQAQLEAELAKFDSQKWYFHVWLILIQARCSMSFRT